VRTLVALACILSSGCLDGISDVNGPDQTPPNAEPLAGCAMACHGADSSNAPPKSVSGATDTSSTAVGAHQQHLNPSPAWHAKVDCADCHVVPATVDAPGHMDGDNKAEVTFSTRVGASRHS